MDRYYGTYQTFETVSKKEGAALTGPDNLVGDVYDVAFEVADGKRIAWLVNRFGAKVGFFDASFSRTLSLIQAKGWVIKPLLSFVAYTDHPEPSRYWGEMAVICYDPAFEDSFAPYVETIARRLGDGLRPSIDIGEQGVRKVIESKGSWTPSQYAELPEKVLGTAIVKKSRSAKESLIEQGRKGNKGCYVLSCIFFAVLAAACILGLKSCGVF